MTAHEIRPGHVCQPCAELAARIAGWASVGAEAGRDGPGGAGQGSYAPTGLETAEEARSASGVQRDETETTTGVDG